MLQEQVEKAPPNVKTIPEAKAERPRSTPWLIAALAIVTVGFLALATLAILDRYSVSEAERVARDAIVAWDTAGPTRLTEAYDPRAVVVAADGAKLVGIDEIVAEVRDQGPTFTMIQDGDISTTADGVYATIPYRFAGHGRGSGISVIKIADGRVIRQWNFGYSIVPTAQQSK
jgi:hypothetical protein